MAVYVIDRCIECLSETAEVLAREVGLRTTQDGLTTEGRAFKEALMTIGVLAGKLEAVKAADMPQPERRQLQFGLCEDCDE